MNKVGNIRIILLKFFNVYNMANTVFTMIGKYIQIIKC